MTVATLIEKFQEDISWLGYNETEREIIEHIKHAIILLKEREPMQVKTDMYGNAYCPWCSTDRSIEMGALRLHLGTQFCPYCGRPVKWE